MLLPSVERRGDICFLIAKRLPYRPRLTIALALMAAGFTIQVANPYGDGWTWGTLPIFIGVLLLLTRGYRNTVNLSATGGTWHEASRESIDRILAIARQQGRWDQDAIDITCVTGFLCFLLVAAVVFFVHAFLAKSSPLLALIVTVDIAVMTVPFWITGVRSTLKNDKLVTKCRMLMKIEKTFAFQASEGETFHYQIMTVPAGDKKEDGVPQDVKAMITFANAPKEFLGLQVQITINSIQGTDYTYCYCVIVCRPEFLAGKDIYMPVSKDILFERQPEKDVHVIVIRQDTTATSKGYYTDPAAACRIFGVAFSSARNLLSKGNL
jgi:hypothetical protein